MINLKRGVAALFVVMVVASAFTGGAAATVSYDSETTNTSTTSDLTGGESIANFNASGDQYKWIEVQSDSNETKLEIQNNETGEVIETFDNSHSSFQTTNSSQGHYAWNISNSELWQNVPVDANSNTTVDIVAYNDTTVDNPDTSTATVTLEATNERTVVYAGDSFTTSSVFEEITESRVAGLSVPADLFGSETNVADIQQDNVAVDGDNTTVTYVLADSNASTPFDDSASAADADERLESQLWVNGDAHAIYQSGSVPDDVDNSSTYGVYDSSTDKLEINVGDDYSDASSLDIEMMGNKDFGILTQLTEFGPLSGVDIPMIGGMITASLPVAARPAVTA